MSVRHQILALDVWGNEVDGYEINDLKTTNIFVELDNGMTNDEIIIAVRAACEHDEDAALYSVDEGSDVEHAIYIYTKNGKPAYFTRASME